SGSKATKIAASAGAVVIAAPVDNDDLGVSLDDPGLQLGATSPWSLLLEDTEAETLRSTLEDLQTSSRTSEQRPTTRAAHVIEYTGPRDITTDPAQDLLDFLQRELDGCDARHVALVVRGTWTPESSGSVSFASGSPLAVVELARELGQALDRRGHGPLALLIFDDPKLLRVENAYELRDVAHVLATGDDTQSIPASETLQGWMNDLIQDCERDAAEALDKPESEPIAPYLQKWRRDVAVRLMPRLGRQGSALTETFLHGLILASVGALCRLFDHLADKSYGLLNDRCVGPATRAGEDAPSLIEWINWVQTRGYKPYYDADTMSSDSRTIHNDWGDLYNWITSINDASSQTGLPLWTEFVNDRNPQGYSSRLLVSIAAKQPEDYRALSFHQDVSLQALLAATRVLAKDQSTPQVRPHWPLISMGLAYGPLSLRQAQLDALIGEPKAAQYFTSLGPPPLMSLTIEKSPSRAGYELSLESSESQAALIRCGVETLDTADQSLRRLGDVMARKMVSRTGFDYLRELGVQLSKDALASLSEKMDAARQQILDTGRSREAHLALQLDAELMGFPWELMQVSTSKPDADTEMLAERYAVGRQMWTDSDRSRQLCREQIKVLIIAAPTTNAGAALPSAVEEGKQVERMLGELNAELKLTTTDAGLFSSEAYIDQELTSTKLRELLRGDFDVLHFAGHGLFDSARPEHSGWILSVGLFSAKNMGEALQETQAAGKKPPWLIYANA
ncbi:MAG: CHAT domain-containing protein, partial [Myxococcales bacterium]|nr:CHAT domain-containing protein [Myxococcales bacterium]